MQILSFFLSCFALLLAMEVIRQSIMSQADRIVEALSGVGPVRKDSVSVIIPLPIRPRAFVEQPERVRLAA
ncbi:MAG: hypothetical protein IPI83_01180 [Sphingomonadales bacterium]|nr:hypothetical protein [Sphingomonadales bacterium]